MEFFDVLGVAICDTPNDDFLDDTHINTIVQTTANTWQSDRLKAEKLVNTIMGKKAEYVLEQFLKEKTEVKYLSYDDFRNDNFSKHAPFDGLIFKQNIDETILENCKNEINNEISRDEYGRISASLRRKLEDFKIFTIEVKSSNLKNNDFNGVDNHDLRTTDNYKQIINNIKKRDFFIYPHFCRSSNNIHNFYEYVEEVRKTNPDYNSLGNRRVISKLVQTEFENACDIYTRLYFDNNTNQVYIPGYIFKTDFYVSPYISKMPGGKSGNALYFMRSISKGCSFFNLESNYRIWNFVRDNEVCSLFSINLPLCKKCKQAKLQICKNANKKEYFYRCFTCESNFPIFYE